VAPIFFHTAQAALDDNDSTFWTTGRDEPSAANIAGHVFKHFQTIPDAPFWQKSGRLEVDLGHPTHLSRAVLKEMIRPSFYAPVHHWQIQAEHNGAWQTLASGTTIGKALEVPFPSPITAQKLRHTLDAPGRPALSEFQHFDNKSSNE
jgi:hypothetical protein